MVDELKGMGRHRWPNDISGKILEVDSTDARHELESLCVSLVSAPPVIITRRLHFETDSATGSRCPSCIL
jgi:hypothetical protein